MLSSRSKRFVVRVIVLKSGCIGPTSGWFRPKARLLANGIDRILANLSQQKVTEAGIGFDLSVIAD
jgi:hypothetical protein